MPSSLTTPWKVAATLALAVSASCTTGAPPDGEAPPAAVGTVPDPQVPGMTPIDVADPSVVFGGGIAQGAFSPDGRWLVLNRREGVNNFSLWTVPAAG